MRSRTLLIKARDTAIVKIFFLFFMRSNRLPLTRRDRLDRNSVPPSMSPNTNIDNPIFSVVRRGSIDIAMVVDTASKKFIKIIGTI